MMIEETIVLPCFAVFMAATLETICVTFAIATFVFLLMHKNLH